MKAVDRISNAEDLLRKVNALAQLAPQLGTMQRKLPCYNYAKRSTPSWPHAMVVRSGERENFTRRSTLLQRSSSAATMVWSSGVREIVRSSGKRKERMYVCMWGREKGGQWKREKEEEREWVRKKKKLGKLDLFYLICHHDILYNSFRGCAKNQYTLKFYGMCPNYLFGFFPKFLDRIQWSF